MGGRAARVATIPDRVACYRSGSFSLFMALALEFEGDGLSDAARRACETLCRAVEYTYAAMRGIAGVPDVDVQVIVTSDFVVAVNRHMPPRIRAEEGEFTTAHLGGRVVGKVLPQDQDYQQVTVVVDGSLLAGQYGPTDAESVFLVAHELAHPFIGRARHASGAMDGIVSRAILASELAQSIGRSISDEYWADRLAQVVMSVLASVDGQAEPVNYWNLTKDRQMSHLEGLLRSAHPALPDLVQQYREGRLPLRDMWHRIVQWSDQALTVFAHAQAGADSGGARVSILDDPPLASLPAVRLYFGDPWRDFCAALWTYRLAMDATPTWLRDVERAGDRMLKTIWSNLGIHPVDLPDRQQWLDVTAPLR